MYEIICKNGLLSFKKSQVDAIMVKKAWKFSFNKRISISLKNGSVLNTGNLNGAVADEHYKNIKNIL